MDPAGLSAVDLTLAALAAVAANVTNTLALAPGALGGLLAQRRQLSGQARRVARLALTALLGGLTGGLLLLHTDEALFRRLVPWLILSAAFLLAVQERLRAWLLARLASPDHAAGGAARAGGGHAEALASDRAVIFPASKDRPVLFGALAWADVLLTLDKADFGALLGGEFYGLPVLTPGAFLGRERSAGRLSSL